LVHGEHNKGSYGRDRYLQPVVASISFSNPSKEKNYSAVTNPADVDRPPRKMSGFLSFIPRNRRIDLDETPQPSMTGFPGVHVLLVEVTGLL
jgi:hypothetical protein